VERWTYGRRILCIPGSKTPKYDPRVGGPGEEREGEEAEDDDRHWEMSGGGSSMLSQHIAEGVRQGLQVAPPHATIAYHPTTPPPHHTAADTLRRGHQEAVRVLAEQEARPGAGDAALGSVASLASLPGVANMRGLLGGWGGGADTAQGGATSARLPSPARPARPARPASRSFQAARIVRA